MRAICLEILLVLAIVSALCFFGCGLDDDDPSTSPGQADDDVDDDDTKPDDDDTVWQDDDDTFYDDDDTMSDDDDTVEPLPSTNPDAKADAFRLFYRERVERTLLVLNRFGVAGDAVFATTFGKNYIAKTGNEYEVVPGPNDNNPIGITAYTAWKLYQAIGGRPLELTLIRLFEGLKFNEQVSGHSGLTCREALPGWTRVMDGVSGTVTRTRFGAPFTSPVTFDPLLEEEILDTFYDDIIVTYRENPREYYFNFKPINELEQYAVTFVFTHLTENPSWMHISNCCSSWMITPAGKLWEGAAWGNHNSRDNFTDYTMGYLAAFEAENSPGLSADLALAAQNAADAARRTGDAIVDANMIQMTVDEHQGDYETLMPGGHMRPDGTTEWQDLGSLASCQMVYVAKAISTEGLSYPVPQLPMPGAIETSAIEMLFESIGISLPGPVIYCNSMGDAILGLTFGEILEMKVMGVPWYEMAAVLEMLIPGLFNTLLGSMMDDFKELVLGAVNLCYYADIKGDQELYNEAHKALEDLVQVVYIVADLVYANTDKAANRADIDKWDGAGAAFAARSGADELYYLAALYGRMFDLDTPLEYFDGFDWGSERIAHMENYVNMGDTSYIPLITDATIKARIDNKLAGVEQWIVQRYEDRFVENEERTYPIRRTPTGYEAITDDGLWHPVENDRHRWLGSIHIFYEAPLCTNNTLHTLDCTWAAMGCAPADLDDSGQAGPDDLVIFNEHWNSYGVGATCNALNGWCEGADMDKNGTLEAEDSNYIYAAMGCVR